MAKNSSFLLTAKQARSIDQRAKEVFGISTLVLMENAGSCVAKEAIEILNKKKNVAIFCGKGNNGGDGLVAARHLLVKGIKVDVFLAARINDVKNEARTNLEILLKLKKKVFEVKPETLQLIQNRARRYDLIIDALLGVGIVGQVNGVCKDLIDIINAWQKPVLSVDIPSGLDATTGMALGSCVKASVTVSFVALKSGMVIAEGPSVCGRVVTRDLGAQLL